MALLVEVLGQKKIKNKKKSAESRQLERNGKEKLPKDLDTKKNGKQTGNVVGVRAVHMNTEKRVKQKKKNKKKREKKKKKKDGEGVS